LDICAGAPEFLVTPLLVKPVCLYLAKAGLKSEALPRGGHVHLTFARYIFWGWSVGRNWGVTSKKSEDAVGGGWISLLPP